MAFHFFDFFRPKDGSTQWNELSEAKVEELLKGQEDLYIRKMCFDACVNLIANALGRCEFRTYRNGAETFGTEHYLWNVEPNTNENSTMFLHKLAARLCVDGEALIVTVGTKKRKEKLAVADGFDRSSQYPVKQNEYKNVRVGDLTYEKTFRENEVLHIRLNHLNPKPVIDGLYQSYYKLYAASLRAYQWSNGQHWKVHVGQIAQNKDGWLDEFQKMINQQFKPFLTASGAVLPEFDGYTYENLGRSGNQSAMDTRDSKALIEDIFQFTAQAYQIPVVMINGTVEATGDATTRFLSNCIDPIADQLQEEINRKRYGLEDWRSGTYLRVDTSSILHFDLFSSASAIEKLLGTGYSINEIRRAANQSTLHDPWADKHYLTKNIGPIEKAGQDTESDKSKGDSQ